MIFRIRFRCLGGHYHCRVFQARMPGHTWEKNGDLIFDEAGWSAFAALVNGRLEIVPDESQEEPSSGHSKDR